mmetsp:Transcript_117946/g.328630  ORF Transcript_117946/g.328630 Transcript_117946/m.328630 type:complete len:207 (-) Transcript_117946:3033-3653(-)
MPCCSPAKPLRQYQKRVVTIGVRSVRTLPPVTWTLAPACRPLPPLVRFSSAPCAGTWCTSGSSTTTFPSAPTRAPTAPGNVSSGRPGRRAAGLARGSASGAPMPRRPGPRAPTGPVRCQRDRPRWGGALHRPPRTCPGVCGGSGRTATSRSTTRSPRRRRRSGASCCSRSCRNARSSSAPSPPGSYRGGPAAAAARQRPRGHGAPR